jgi:hypothetical protein
VEKLYGKYAPGIIRKKSINLVPLINALAKELEVKNRGKILAAWMVSNCDVTHSQREVIVEELKKYMEVFI